MATLVLLRHGESVWNAEGLFTGWVDVGLSKQGFAEAEHAGELLASSGLRPGVVHTSVLTRAIQTANTALDTADLAWLPVRRSWRLNERHYGGLQGKNKAQIRAEYGEQQFMAWRRSYDVPPPPIADDDPLSQAGDPRYALLPDDLLPRTECLRDVVWRMLPYWHDAIVPDLAVGQTVLVVAHGNSLRGLVKHLDGIGDAEIAALNIPTGIPLVYELDDRYGPLRNGGEYLDPEAAKVAAEAVRNQGK
jgi:2,3-bisphosphoglycerate-dependent phosphoglycerate mutase